MFELIFVICTLGSTPAHIAPFGQCWIAEDQPLFKTEAACEAQSEVLINKLGTPPFPIQTFSLCKNATTI
jgi:hypothetical protein